MDDEGLTSHTSSSDFSFFFSEDENAVRVGDVLQHLKTNRVVISGGRDPHGAAIITFPSSANTDFVSEEFDKLMRFVSSVPSEDVQDIGFTVIADMRNKDLVATNSLLRHLQRQISVKIHTVYVVKPHSFWQKKRTAMSHKLSRTKYSFEVIMVSNPQELLKFVDVRQLTVDLHGELHHDQDLWIDMQMSIESLFHDVIEIGCRYRHVDSVLKMTKTATSLEEAEMLLKNHNELKPLYHGSGLQPILDRFSELARKVYRSSEDGPRNPDFVAARARLGSLLEKLESKRRKLEVNWDKTREKLESCMHWRKLESDVDKLLVWITKTMETCLEDFPNIGTTPGTTEQLVVAHGQLEEAITENQKMVLSVTTESSSLLEHGHYASENIRRKSEQLQQEFSELSEMITNRSTLLCHALAFHSTVFSFLHDVVEWRLSLEDKSLNGTVSTVEAQIRDSKSIRDLIIRQFGDLQKRSVNLIEWLQNLAGKSLSALGFDLSVKHVKEFMVKANEEKQALETLWQGKMQVLSQGLGLRLFEKEAQKVHEWLNESGFTFLLKNKDIGDDHSSAVLLLDEHKSFESNLKVMNSTTHKLLRSSEDLASSGQCDPEQICAVADQLEERMYNFVAQSERRREQLEMSVAFQKTVEGLLDWMNGVELEVADISYPDSADHTKLMINDSQLKRNHSAVQTANTLAQGQSLINKLSEPLESTGESLLPNYYENKRKIANTMERLQERHAHVDSLLADRKMKFDICLVLRTFEAVTHDHLQEIDRYVEHCESNQLAPNVDSAVAMLKAHNDYTESIEVAYTDVTETGHNLLSRLSESNIQLTVSSTNMKPAAVHVRETLDQLAEKFYQLQTAGEERTVILEQCLQLRDYETNVAQVAAAIADSYAALVSQPRIVAKTLEKAEALLAHHEGFEVSIETMNDSVQNLVAQVDEFEKTDHYDLATVQELAVSLDDQWTSFAEAVDNRHSLLTMSHDIHRHHDELTSRSITLQKEFGNTSIPDSVAHTETTIEQHKEQRDFFVQECDRFVADSNQLLDQLKELALPEYCEDHGVVVNAQYEENMKRIQVMLEGMGVRQRKTLRMWEKRNRILEQLWEQLGFIDDAKKITDWVYNCLQSMKTQSGVGSSLDNVDKLITDLEAFESKDIQGYHEKTLLLMERAAELQKYEHCDTGRLRVRMAVLNSSWQDLEDYLTKHKERLKLSREFYGVLSQFQSERDHVLLFLNKFTDRTDVCESSTCAQSLIDDLKKHQEEVLPSLNAKLSHLEALSHQIQDSRIALKTELVAAHCHALEADMTDRAIHLVKLLEQHVQIEKEKDDRKRQERRRDLLLEELLQTEDQYVKDMEYVLEHYHKEMANDGPVALMGKEHIVLGNMDEMLDFHRGTFFVALKEASKSSEEVAKCFVTWEDRLLDLYLGYCKTKPLSESLLAEKAQNFLTEWQLSRGHSIALGAYLIKPVQRITRYHLLLQELAKYCQRLKDPMENLNKALQIMREIPKKTNDVMNFSMVRDYEGNSDSIGQLYHQDSFTVVDSKILRSKEKEQQLFFFLEAIIVCKRVRDQLGNVTRYSYRTSLKTREMMLTEFVEGEPCKFCIASAKSLSETKYIFKAKSIDAKQEAVKVVRHILQQVQPVPSFTLERGGLRRSLKGKKKKTTTLPLQSEKSGFRPTLALAVASIIGGGDARGPSDVEVLSSPISPVPRSSSTLDFRGSRSRAVDVANRIVVARPANLEESGEVDDLTVRDRRGTSSPPSEDEYHRSDSISAVRLTRAKVVRAKSPRKATIVRLPSEQQGVGVLQRVPPKKQDVSVVQSVKTSSPPQPQKAKARSTSPPVLLHRSSARAMLIPGSRSAVTSCTYTELPAVGDVTGSRRDKMSDRVTWLKHSVSDGDLEQSDPEAQNGSSADNQVSPTQSESSAAAGGPLHLCANAEASIGSGSRRARQSRQNYAIDTGVSSKQEGNKRDRSISQPVIGIDKELLDSTVRRPRQEWKRQLVVRRRGVKSLKEWRRNLDVETLAVVVQRSTSSPNILPETGQILADMDTVESQDSDHSQRSKSPSAVAIRQRYVLQELMDTERDYVAELARFIHTYGQEMKSPNLPDSLKGKYHLVFGNIEEVYAFHMNTFLPALESVADDVLSIAKCFSSRENELARVYVVYCENKPRSELFLANFQGTFFDEIRQQLGERLSLADYLIKPVQRIMKYSLLLKGLLKYSKLLGKEDEALHLEAALKVTSEVPKQANNAVQLSMIEGYEGNIHAVGDLLLKDEFLVSDVKDGHGKQKKRHIFLLEQVVILAAVKNKGDGTISDGFVCKDSLKVKEVGVIDSATDDDRKFELWTGKMSKPKQKYELQAISDEIKWAWVKQIGKLLSEQLQLMRALTAFSKKSKQVVGRLISATTEALRKVDSVESDDLVDEEDQWDDSPPLHTVDLQSDPYVAAVSYTASERDTSEGIISFQQGQEFHVIDQSDGLWWLVQVANSSDTGNAVEGWVPASYLDKKEDYENMIKEQQLSSVSGPLKEDIPKIQTESPEVDEQDLDSSPLDIHRYSSISRKGSIRRKANSASGPGRYISGSPLASSNEDVSGLSFIHRFPRKARCFSGSSVTLACMPELEDQKKKILVKWAKNDMEIQPSSKYRMAIYGAEVSLTILYLEPSDAAQYNCTITSGDLTGSCRCSLIVRALEDAVMHEELEDYCDLGDKIGIGRFSLVRSCTERSSGVEYAVKIFKKHHQEIHDAFLAELAALSALRHPRIVELHQAIDSSKCYSLILERIRGAELFEYVVSNECLSEQVARGYIAQILDGLSFMHCHDMAHLDLKPDNIMVISEEKEPKVKLIDFGSCMRLDNSHDQSVMKAVGSPEFYAPEVIKKQSVSLASDIWSVGAITYTLLTGFSPFYANNVEETAINVAALKCSYQTTPWRNLSEIAKHFVQHLLKNNSSKRLTVVQCLEHTWIKSPSISTEIIDTSNLKTFVARRKWQREVTTDIVLKEQVSIV